MYNEIGQQVKFDLKLRQLKCKSMSGCNVTTTVLSVSMDLRQVSEASKGLRDVLNSNYVPPTGQKLGFITRVTDNHAFRNE